MNKNLLFYIALIIFAAVAAKNVTAQNPTYILSAKNFQFTDSLGDGIDAMTFDIVIEHTNLTASGPFEFALGQYYFNFNSSTGITPTEYTYFKVIGSTQFTDTNAIPRNPTIVNPDATSPLGASLRVNSNNNLLGSGPIVATYPGTRVCTMKLKKKVGNFPVFNLNMVWRKALPNPFTKIYAYIGTILTDISNSVPGVNQATVEQAGFVNALPVLTNPLNNSINIPAIVDFTWNKVFNAVRYQIQIATDSLFNYIFYTDQYVYDTTISLGGFNYATKYYWKVYSYDINNISYNSSVWNFKIQEIPALKLKITALIEGMYYPVFNQLSRSDSVKIELRQSVSPYNIIATGNSTLDSLSFTSFFYFPSILPETFYIVYKHFNSLDTWSKSGGETFNYTDTSTYNFTSSASQAFGNNLKLKGSKYCIISGDVDRDGYIDASDASPIDNDSYISRAGRLLATDLNGDNFVDAEDMNIQDNNRNRSVIQPKVKIFSCVSIMFLNILFLNFYNTFMLISNYTIKTLNTFLLSLLIIIISSCSKDEPTSPNQSGIPSKPKNLTKKYVDNDVVLKWDTPDNTGNPIIIKYLIYRKLGSSNYENIGFTIYNITTFKDTSVIFLNTYNYYVTAINTNSESESSNEIIAIPHPFGTDASISSIASNGNDLYVGGVFLKAGGISSKGIAKWDGTSWSALGSGLNGYVSSVATSESDLFVGGGFTIAGGVSVTGIAKWDGTSWSALGGGINGSISSIAIEGNDLYVCGQFTMAGGVSANNIAKWNGSSWSALGSGLNGINSVIYSIAINGNNVYAGGHFTIAGEISVNNIAKWNGSSWTALSSGITSSVFSIAINGNYVYVGGSLTSAGEISTNGIARWDETNWSALGSGISGVPYSIAIIGNEIYAGGYFSTAGGVVVKNIAKWNGSEWSGF